MLAALQQLHIMALGFALMLGFLSPSDVARKLARMFAIGLFLPIGIDLVCTAGLSVWAGLSTSARAMAVLIGVPAAIFLLMACTRFGRNALAQLLGSLMHTVIVGALRLIVRLVTGSLRALVSLLTLPLRLLRGLMQILLRR